MSRKKKAMLRDLIRQSNAYKAYLLANKDNYEPDYFYRQYTEYDE